MYTAIYGKQAMDILLIDDHPAVNIGIATILESTGVFTISGQAGTLGQAMDIIEKSETLPALVLLDLILGEENGLDFLPMLKKYCAGKKIPAPPVLVCSAVGDSFTIQTALKLGAAGYMSKAGGSAELLKGIYSTLGGKIYVSEDLKAKLTEESKRIYAMFTKTEIKVVNLMKAGKTNPEIADQMCISIRTVENYTNKIYFKTGLSGREEVRRL